MSSESVTTLFSTCASQGKLSIFDHSAGRPFLSIVTRTQGRRPHTLAEVLNCLAAQTDTDFEILIIGHRLDDANRIVVEASIADTPLWVRNRIRLIPVAEGNRTRPLNVGFAAARGDYIAVLDDDEAVFAHWVETFRTLAHAIPGRVLRSVSAQQVVNTVAVLGERGLRAEDAPNMPFPATFNFFDHLLLNRSPPLSLAFPRKVIDMHALTFDETLTTTEDWDFTMRVVAVAGVAEAADITSIYRFWDKGESSRTLHDSAEWVANHHRIWNKWNAAPLTLPPGSVRQLIGILEEHAAYAAELRRLRHVGVDSPIAAAVTCPEPRVLLHGARRELEQIFGSSSWRVTAPFRHLMVLLGHEPPRDPADVHGLDVEHAEAWVWQLRQSNSWRITAPFRAFKRWIGRLRPGRAGRWIQ